jgi:glycosyltransferase involved in cell wall biosynthesis
MRIVYLHQYFLTPDQSGGIRSYQFARALSARGHDVHVVTATAPAASCSSSDRGPRTVGGKASTEVVDGITVHRLPVPYDNGMSDARRIVAFATFALRAMRRARALQGDVVVATSTPLTIAIPGIAATIGRRAPMVFEVRDAWPEVPIALGSLGNPVLRLAARALERLAYAASSTVIALSPGMARSVVATGHPRRRTEIVTNISDVDRFDPTRADAEEFLSRHPRLRGRRLAVYCGTFGRANGVGHLVVVAHHVRHLGGDLCIVLLGSGAEKDRVRARAAELGVLDENLVVLDPVAKADLPDVLAAATVALSSFVEVPALEANSANKYFDALAAHRPVVVNYGGWQAEALAETGAGIRIDRDPVVAAGQLAAFVDDPDVIRRAGAAAGRLAADRHALADLSARFCDIVERDAARAGVDV